jgi:signal transduction histidine kinase/ActR/RegA family two-component response regulator
MDHSVVSGVTVLIPTREKPFGVFSVHSARHREFTSDDVQFLLAVANVIGITVERLGLGEQLRQSQKMESIGQLAAGVAHDFNNMLTIIQGHTSSLLKREMLPPQILDPIQAIYFATERAAGLTRQLLMFSRKNVMQVKPLDLREVVDNMVRMLQRLFGETIKLELELPDELPLVEGDVGMIEQVVMNIGVNARDAMPQGGRLVICLEAVAVDAAHVEVCPQARAGSFVRLRMRDTGAGMDAATRAHLFEPFFTTKEVGKGAGLGLATVYGIVRQHEGWIEVESEPGQGATFDVFFPTTTLTAQTVVETPGPASYVKGGSETIFLVEDEAILRQMARDVLEGYGYRILEASTGKEALDMWRLAGGKIDLLLTDMIMPDGISGAELAKRLQSGQPHLKVVFTSGYTANEVNAEMLAKTHARFLQKPYTEDVLAKTVREALDEVASVEPPPQTAAA